MQQSFEMKRMKRSEITLADYNPRMISESAYTKLKANLKRNGLVMPLVVNSKTGNLVAGHMRLTALDEITEAEDYELDVAVINVSLKREKEINVFLNNQNVQGDFDLEKLEALLPELGLDEIGFDLGDLAMMFPDSFYEEPENVKEELAMLEDIKRASLEAKKGSNGSSDDGNSESTGDGDSGDDSGDGEALRKIKESRKDSKERYKLMNDQENYVILVFNARSKADEFISVVGGDQDSRYIDGVKVLSMISATS